MKKFEGIGAKRNKLFCMEVAHPLKNAIVYMFPQNFVCILSLNLNPMQMKASPQQLNMNVKNEEKTPLVIPRLL